MSGKAGIPVMPVAVAVYSPEQYPRLLASAEDAADLEATWEKWHQTLQETRQKMASSGIYLIDVLVDLDDLAAYCQQRGLPNTGSTRAEYAAHLLSQQGKQQVGRQIHPSSKPASKKKKHRKR